MPIDGASVVVRGVVQNWAFRRYVNLWVKVGLGLPPLIMSALLSENVEDFISNFDLTAVTRNLRS